MSQNNISNNDSQEDQKQSGAQTPLEKVQEQQAMQQENRDVAQHPDTSPEVPGASVPSDRRHHPQRQMYGSGTNES
jgi:hypothetical protein